MDFFCISILTFVCSFYAIVLNCIKISQELFETPDYKTSRTERQTDGQAHKQSNHIPSNQNCNGSEKHKREKLGVSGVNQDN